MSELAPCPRCKRERPSHRAPTVEDCMCTPEGLRNWETSKRINWGVVHEWTRRGDEDWDYYNDDDTGA